jgi:hypothetical protein
MKKYYHISILCIVVLLSNACVDLPDPLPRDTALGDFSGSARWAYDLAEPRIADLLPDDAVIYYISGNSVGLDGRLASNRGSWEFRFWSESQGRSKGVSVSWEGVVERSVLTTDIDPTDTRNPIPDGWLNSTEIYEAACPGCGSTGFGIANFNYADPEYADGQALWMLLNVDNQLVRWDGVLVEGP